MFYDSIPSNPPARFTRENLRITGSSEVYLELLVPDGNQTRVHFVARFKYNRPGSRARAFARFLRLNMTPLEYFTARKTETPLAIVKARGFREPGLQAPDIATLFPVLFSPTPRQ